MRKLSLSLIIFVFLSWPVLTLAQSEQGGDEVAGPPTAEESAKAAENAAPAGRKNSADQINVKLQVPLPFVPMTCFVTDVKGNKVKYEDGTYIPAVCKLTDYLAGLYRLLIGVGALFAVVMFIIAGYQWIFSGGSSDKVGAAKKRIMGAAMGLILALLSYVILNSISARLVELRLPLVDPVPPIYFSGGEYCNNSQSLSEQETKGKKITVVQENSEQLPPAPMARTEAQCGQSYTVLVNGEQGGQCNGGACPNRGTCINNQCQEVVMYGNIEWGLDGTEFSQLLLGSNAYVDKIQLYYLCNNDSEPRGMSTTPYEHDVKHRGRHYSIPRDLMTATKTDFEYYKQIDAFKPYSDFGAYAPNPDVYRITQYQRSFRDCVRDKGGFKGYVLKVEVNDDDGSWKNILSTIDDDFAVGKNCSRSLAQTNADGTSILDFNKIDFSKITSDQLIQIDDLNKGFNCDITITREYFPTR